MTINRTPKSFAEFRRTLALPGVTLALVEHYSIVDGETRDKLARHPFANVPRTLAKVQTQRAALVSERADGTVTESWFDYGKASEWVFANGLAMHSEHDDSGNSYVMVYRIGHVDDAAEAPEAPAEPETVRIVVAVQERPSDTPILYPTKDRAAAVDRFGDYVSDHPERLAYVAEFDAPAGVNDGAIQRLAIEYHRRGVSSRDLTEYHPGDALRGDEAEREAERNSVPPAPETINVDAESVTIEAETGDDVETVYLTIASPTGGNQGEPILSGSFDPDDAERIAHDLLRAAAAVRYAKQDHRVRNRIEHETIPNRDADGKPYIARTAVAAFARKLEDRAALAPAEAEAKARTMLEGALGTARATGSRGATVVDSVDWPNPRELSAKVTIEPIIRHDDGTWHDARRGCPDCPPYAVPSW